MAKPPKTEKDIEDKKIAEDAIEDAVVLDEPEADLDEPVAADVAAESLSEDDAGADETPVADDPEAASATDPEIIDAEPAAPAETAPETEADHSAAIWTASEEAGSETPEEQDNPTPEPTPVVASQTSTGSGGAIVGFVIGGLIAGAIGFGAAQYASGGWPFAATDSESDPISETLDQQSAQIAELRGLVDSNSAALSGLEGDTSLGDLENALRGDLAGVQTSLSELSDRFTTLEARITELEKMPNSDSAAAAEAAAAAYERELADMRSMLDAEIASLQEQQAEAETLQVNAAEAAQAAAARAALSRIMAALDSGQPFDDALFDLTTATGADAPQGLAAVATEGVPTLSELQASFPEVAREALNASLRAMVEAGEIGRGAAFLRTQLGTRSLEPREGDDPDAILSRAEFALSNGRISEALQELDGMPPAADAALAPWIERARTRQAALDAGASLAQDVNN